MGSVFFFKKLRPLVKLGILHILNDFILGRIDIARLNREFSRLSLKSQRDKITQFRPIALINVVFKIVSKALATKLDPIANRIISPNQPAFIKGRVLGQRALVWYIAFRSWSWEAKRRFLSTEKWAPSSETREGNPSKEIFSELAKSTPGGLFLHEASKTERETKWGHEVATHRQRGLAPAAWPVVWALVTPDLPFRLQIAFVAKPPVPRATIRKTFQRRRGRGESSPEGLYIIMPTSGLMRE
ncbi:hypothetical protein QYE76_066325 [Lolium multiflorum]|uniref:Reverse transcriptase domain-containing protein n=1 Tax=Lolium multiflorum TaxID=4521 RepID=A0AAD8SAT3_LOLMU|nr:hypothetical protein QYE76_066325 [Lolium multiflorum]